MLLLIDLQQAIDHPDWGIRNNPDAEKQVMRLLSHWRAREWPIIHIRHDSREPRSHYRPGQAGNMFKPETAPLPGEVVIAKTTNSAFIGTDLELRLRRAGHCALVVAGVITTNSVEATGRMAGNLGFDNFRPGGLARHGAHGRRDPRHVACQSGRRILHRHYGGCRFGVNVQEAGGAPANNAS